MSRHVALPVAGNEELVASGATVVDEGRADGRRVLVLARSDELDDLRAALGAPTDVAFVATDEHGRNPSRLVTLLHGFATASDRAALAVVEPFAPDQSAGARDETVLSDAVLNLEPMLSLSLSVVCLVDAAVADPASVAAFGRNQARLPDGRPNPDYDPHAADRLFAAALPDAPSDAATLSVPSHGLGAVREFVRTHSAAHGLPADRIDDLVLAANEIVTNSLRHGPGTARVRTWSDGVAMVCEVHDGGSFHDPLAGRLAPDPAATGGRGLWLANHLCDLVQVRSSPSMGTTVRLSVDSRD